MDKTNKYLVILIIVAGLLGMHLLFKIDVLLPIALGIAVISIISSFIAGLIVWLWDKIALVLGTINSKILLTVIFYVFLFPVAIMSRVFKKKDALILKKLKEGSYYKERNYKYVKEDLEQVF